MQFSADTLVLEVEVVQLEKDSQFVFVYFVLYGALQYRHKIELNKNYFFEINQDVDNNQKVIFKVLCEEVKDGKNEWQHRDPENVFSKEIEDYKDFHNVKVYASDNHLSFDGCGMVSNLKWLINKGKGYRNYLNYQQ